MNLILNSCWITDKDPPRRKTSTRIKCLSLETAFLEDYVGKLTVSWSIDSVPHFESALATGSCRFQFISQQNVFFSLIGEEQSQLGIVAWVTLNSADQLQHWSDTRSACKKTRNDKIRPTY